MLFIHTISSKQRFKTRLMIKLFSYLLLIVLVAGVLLYNMWMISRIDMAISFSTKRRITFYAKTTTTRTNKNHTASGTVIASHHLNNIDSSSSNNNNNNNGRSSKVESGTRWSSRLHVQQPSSSSSSSHQEAHTGIMKSPIQILEDYKSHHSTAVLQKELLVQQQQQQHNGRALFMDTTASSNRTFLVAALGNECPISKPGFANALFLAIVTNRTLLVQYPNHSSNKKHSTSTNNNKRNKNKNKRQHYCPEQNLQQADWLGVWDDYREVVMKQQQNRHNNIITWWQDLVANDAIVSAADNKQTKELQRSKAILAPFVVIGMNVTNENILAPRMTSSLFYDNSQPSLMIDLRDDAVRQNFLSVLRSQQQQQSKLQEEEQGLYSHLLLETLYQQGPQYLQGVLFWSSFSVPNKLSLVSSMRRKKQKHWS